MQLRPEQLAQHLKQGPAACYLLSGEEPLLIQECADAIRAASRAAGCLEREVIDIGANSNDWQQLTQSAGALSLFADRKLIELRLPSGKPGTDGSKALQEYLALNSDDILLIVAGKIDKQSQRSKWYTGLDNAGVVIQVWPVRASELPRWLAQRMSAAGLQVQPEALSLLAERVEGNLLAAVQEVEKLKLLAENNTVTVDTIIASVADNARFNSFGLADTAMDGDARNAIRTLRGLQAEASAPPVVLWTLARDVKLLIQLHEDTQAGISLNQALTQRGVWRNRAGLVQKALRRHDSVSLAKLQHLTVQVDGAVKGFSKDDPWVLLEQLLLLIALGGHSKTRRRSA